MCKSVERKTKKVYRLKHAEAKTKAYKRDKSNKLNPLDYVGNNDFSEFKEEATSVHSFLREVYYA